MSDADAFEAFVRHYQDMVFATAVRLLGNPAEAEDVAQTVFLRAFERFESLKASPTAAGWLKTVATNLSLNHLSRYRARWRLFSEMGRADAAVSSDAEPPFEVVADLPPPEAALDAADQHDRLERALGRLPDHQRVPLVLFHFEDRSYLEIAAILGASLGKIKMDMHRGRLALRAEMERNIGSC